MEPPAARVDVVRDVHFGVSVEDPYRWMEQPSAEYDAWLSGQGRYAREVLDALPHRKALLDRIRELRAGPPDRHTLALAGGRIFALREDPAAGVPVLVEQQQEDETERVLFDPNAIGGAAHSHLDWHVPSPDGRHVACAVSVGGAGSRTLRILDVARGAVLDDAIGNVVFPFLAWSDDGQSFVYHRYLEPPPGAPPDQRRLDSRSCRHRLGTDPAGDLVLLARGLTPRVPLAPLDRPFLYRQPGSDWVVAVVSHSSLGGETTDEQLSDCTLYVARWAELADPPSCRWARVAEPADEVTAFAVGRDTLYLVGCRDAPRGRVLAVPLADPAMSRASVVVPQGERVVEAVRVVGDRLLVRDRDAGAGRLRRVPLAGGEPREVAPPSDGTILEWAGAATEPVVLLRVQSWTEPPRTYRYDAGSGAVTDTGWTPPAPARSDQVRAYRIVAPARDGMPVPITVVHRAGLVRNGRHPTVLEAYGSYGEPFTPRFRSLPALLAWLEYGGVWAAAHVRGGGEYGETWHEAGRLLAKENTITDFIDCAEQLVAQGYTTPDRLAASAGSAGSIPTAGAAVRRPELFAAIVIHVPVLDALRNELTENGPVNVPEFGTVSTEAGFASLRIIDAYRRIRDGVAYPAILLTTGRNDPRVPTWQPAKAAARLQAATASGRPVLLRVEEHGGHALIGSTAEQHDALRADELAFLLHHLGGTAPAS